MTKTTQHINKKNLVTFVMSVMMLVLLFASIKHKKSVEISKVNVRISKIKGQNNLINKKDVYRLFRGYLGYDVTMSTIEELDLRMLEKVLSEDSRVKKAELYIDSNNKLNVYIKQRKPIVRVNNGDAFQYYLDEDSHVIPVQHRNPLRLPIATGNIEDIEHGLYGKGLTNLKSVYKVADYIAKDKFLSAFIEQIHIREDNTVVAITKVGGEKVIVGDVASLEESFSNMKLYYRKTLPKNGWHNFSQLNLSYKGQVVSTKRNM